MNENSWQNKTVVMLGAGRQGIALARFMCAHGASVILTDQRDLSQLEDARGALDGLPIRWVVGGHPFSLLKEADLICVTGGADPQMPFLREAAARAIPIANDTEIFMRLAKAPIIGITGSSGKTTTTTLLGRMAHAQAEADARSGFERKVWVGGNIGNPLLDLADGIRPQDIVILELSSFQLELVTRSPHIGAMLNITPNHLDRHGTMEAYIAAKKHIFSAQNADDCAVLCRDNENSWALRHELRGSLVSFGFKNPSCAEKSPAFYLSGEKIRLLLPGGTNWEILDLDQIKLRGGHNLLNVMAACAIAYAAGFSVDAMREGILGFYGVEHRLEFIRGYRGAQWYNDSIATAPERTLAAIASFEEPLILLLGGRDKKLPWDDLAREAFQRAYAILLFGEAGAMIEAALNAHRPSDCAVIVERFATLEEAARGAARLCRPGDVVLLSPGCTSYDAYKDFEERGRAFKQWVRTLE